MNNLETPRGADLVFRHELVSQTMTSSGSEIHDLMDAIIRFKICKVEGAGANGEKCKRCPLDKTLVRHGYPDSTIVEEYIELSLCRILQEIEDRIHAGYFKLETRNTQRRLNL